MAENKAFWGILISYEADNQYGEDELLCFKENGQWVVLDKMDATNYSYEIITEPPTMAEVEEMEKNNGAIS